MDANSQHSKELALSEQKEINEDLRAEAAGIASKSHKVTVFGGGTFATALATLFARNNHQVTMLLRDADVVKSINEEHKNCYYLSEFVLSDKITATLDPVEALKDTEYILHAVPVQASPDFLASVAKHIPPKAPIISLSKGIHAVSLKFMVDIFHEVLGADHPTAFFSGPSFAKEIMEAQPTGVVIASADFKLATILQYMISNDRVRCYTTTDVLGVEIGGALKNVYAIAAGIAEGMGFKNNTAALLVTRGCSEMKKLAYAMGAKHVTLNGLSGIGDLMLTCYGGASRNRSVGVRLGKGETLEDIIKSMSEVAEGVPTAAAAAKLAEKYNVSMPLAQGVADVLSGKIGVNFNELDRLMGLPLHPED